MPCRRNVLTFLLAGLSWVAASASAGAQTSAENLEVVATFSIVADFVREVGGDRVALTTLVGADGDAHVYSPAPGDSRRLAQAKLIVSNGLGLEGWMARLIKSSGTKAAVVEAAKGIKARKSDDAHAHGGFDPHAWQDVANAKVYVANIRNALASADPAGREVYEANATAYLDALDALDREVRTALAAIPPERRRIITTHDAFGYFKAAYGLDFVAPQGVSTEAEASAKDVARIIRQIKAERIPAVFLENVSDPRLMDRIARETGARTGPKLYSDALSGPDGPAGTYIAMVRHNIRAFSEALSR
jgi:zinc/manganese transport system substrate-binding protein